VLSSSNFVNPDVLATTEWLGAHLDDPDLVIVDCDMFDSYQRAHIKGAVGIKVHHYIKHPDYANDPKGHPLVAEPNVAKDIFESMGIDDSATVISYDSNGSLWAARFWWVLNYYGHANAKVLDGGWKKWFDEGRAVSVDSNVPGDATFTPKTQDDLVCSLDRAIERIEDGDTLFLDVRSDGEWNGRNDRGNSRAGRVPGSVHVEWLNFVNTDRYQTFKSAEEINQILSEAGVTPEKEVVTY
ncbi:uncharacterized protein METZ01_LOCUS269719, partial [marine metagenome]